ncbi:MAG: aminoglycoside phosphotransferase family protein [Anaerolineaceae bacterium]|nr:aminoglycoside phosphotransferase family protein [Anaerolineaceae bacterium]
MQFMIFEPGAHGWHASLTPAELTSICKRGLGSTTNILSITEQSGGMFNKTYVILFNNEQKLILRVSPPSSAYIFYNELNLMRREHTIQPYLASISHLIPKTIMSDFTHEIIDRDYVFQSFLEGERWDDLTQELTRSENDELWRQNGQIAKKISCTHGKYFGYPLPQKQFLKWSDAVIDMISGMHADLIALNVDDTGITGLVQTLQAGSDLLDDIKTPQLIHGDIWEKNILIDRTGPTPRIVGLLDAERAFWGDPMADWIYHRWEVPQSYWEGYGRIAPLEGYKFRTLAYRCMIGIQAFLESHRCGNVANYAYFKNNMPVWINEMKTFLSQ